MGLGKHRLSRPAPNHFSTMTTMIALLPGEPPMCRHGSARSRKRRWALGRRIARKNYRWTTPEVLNSFAITFEHADEIKTKLIVMKFFADHAKTEQNQK